MNRRNFLVATAAAPLAASLAPVRSHAAAPTSSMVSAARACLIMADICMEHCRVQGAAAADCARAVAQVRAVLQGVPVLASADDPVYLGMLAPLAARVCAQAAVVARSHADQAPCMDFALACEAVSAAS